MNPPIYLDHHATTPLDSEVLDAMLPYLKEKFGNSSSIDHFYGNEALAGIEKAREQISGLIGAEPEEILFTSGATESDNLALFGVAQQYKDKGNHIITCVTEHKAILDPCQRLVSLGFDISCVGVNKDGEIDLNELEQQINDKTILISVMAANNEIGTIVPLKEIGELAHSHNILFHTDAAQAFGHIPINVKDMSIDLMSVSGHKIYGPKGIGALFVRRKNSLVKLTPIIFGGGHERGMRSGTLNVPGIVGFGQAAEIAKQKMNASERRLRSLAKQLFDGIAEKVEVEINGNSQRKLSHNLNVYFDGVEAKALINEVKDAIAISTGSACTTNDVKPSHVLKALGYDDDRVYSSIRFGLGRSTTEEEIDKTIEVIIKTVRKLRNL